MSRTSSDRNRLCVNLATKAITRAHNVGPLVLPCAARKKAMYVRIPFQFRRCRVEELRCEQRGLPTCIREIENEGFDVWWQSKLEVDCHQRK